MRKRLTLFKKLFALCLMLVLVLSLAACGEENGGGGEKEHEWTEDELFWDADQNGIEDWQEEEIELTYATWQYSSPDSVTIDTLLIEAFMEKYPKIHVTMQIIEGLEDTWENNLLALTETPEMIPDVFLVNRVERELPYGILADITDYFNHDEETDYIFESVKDLGLYDGKRYVIPTFIYPTIWIVNLDLLSSCNIPAPNYDWTWSQMEAIAKAVYDARGTEHKIGLYGTDQYYFELPKIMKMATDPEVGSTWLGYGFDGESFNFDDQAYLNAVSKLEQGMQEGWLVNSIAEETLIEYYGTASDPRYSNQVAIWRQPAWEFKDYAADLQFEWDVYPGPSGVTGGNTDVCGISELCEHKAAAYQLAKWMSFGEEGLITRYRLYAEYGDELYVSANNYPYPVVDYGINGQGVNEIWDNIPYTQTADGFGADEFVESLRNGAIKANKEVVGWDAAENKFKEYISQIIMEGQTYAALYETIQEDCLAVFKAQRDAVAEAIGK